MDTGRLLILVILIAGMPLMKGQGAAKPVEPLPRATTPQYTQPVQPRPVDIELLLKYQEFLRKESAAANAGLVDMVDRVKNTIYLTGICIVSITALCGFLGIRSYQQAVASATTSTKARIDAEAEQRLRDARDRIEDELQKLNVAGRETFDKRLEQLEKVYARRQEKYLRLLQDYFSVVFEANPDHKRLFLGHHFDGNRFHGKRILWVEDDAVGIALLVELLKCCGLQIVIRTSTDDALHDSSLGDYDLIISNLRRDPEENAGLLLAQRLRERHCHLPIIIFTRPARVPYYSDVAARSRATLVTTRPELFSRIAQDLEPSREEGVDHAVGQP